MRVIIDARESGTSTGRYIDKLVEYLHKLKPEFEIVILAKSHRLEFFKAIAPRFKVERCDYKEFTYGEQYGLTWQLYGMKADLVHFNAPQQPVLYFGRAVTTVHDLTTIRFNNPSKNYLVYKFKQRVYKWVVKRVAKKSIRLITPSKYVKDDLAKYAGVDPAKITVTNEAADKITAAAEPVKDLVGKKFIMYVGRPLPHKNLPRLAETFEQIKKTHPDLKLVLAGKKDALFERLERRVKKQGISGVVFTGFVSEGQLLWLYQNCAAYVFPSLSEGFGLPGLEAMQAGAPVVSSNASCLPEIYGNAAHYFNPKDQADMAGKISEVLDNPELRASLISAGKVQAGKYSWQRMAEQTLAVYKKVLSK
jgi:glycosyltransferase involved in cell wall biosynthesis